MTTTTPSLRGAIACLRVVAPLVLLASSFALADSPMDMADIRVSSSLRQEFTVEAGDARSGVLTIENRGAADANVTITQADIAFDEVGAVVYQDANSSASSNASWILVPTRVSVPAGGQVKVPFTIEVPAAAGLHGSYWSVLRIQAEAATSVTTEAPFDLVTTRVDVIVQYGVTVLTHVGTPDARTLRFEQPAFWRDPASGEHRLDVALRNPGAYVVSAELWLELYDQDGGLIARINADAQRIYPAVSTRTRFDLGALDQQAYQAVVVADAGGSDVFGTRYDLDTSR